MTSSGSEHTPSDPGQPPPAGSWGPPPGPAAGSTGPTAPARSGVDLGRLRLADYAVAIGTVLYLVFMVLPWYSIDGFDLGSGYSFPGVSVNGFDSGTLTFAFVLLLLASAWALLPAFAEVAVPFPRSFLTAGLAALAFVLTLIEWLSTFNTGFTFFGLLTFLTSVAVLAFAVLRLLPELGGSASVPSGLAGPTRWANGQAPQFGRGGQRGAATQPPTYGQPAPGTPPAGYGQPPVAPPVVPPAPGGSTGEPGDRPTGV